MTEIGPRHREKIETEKSSYFSQTTRTVFSKPPVTTVIRGLPVIYDKSYKSLEMDDVVIPGYEYLLKTGRLLPCNPMFRAELTKVNTPPIVNRVYTTGLMRLVTDYEDPQVINAKVPTVALSAIDQKEISDLGEKAALKAFARVDSSKVLLLSSIAELTSTKDMLIKAGRMALGFMKSLRHLKKTLSDMEIFPTRRGQLLATAENTWMEIRMGWMPFIGEVTSIYKAINSTETPPPRQTFRASAQKSAAAEQTGTLRYGFFDTKWKSETTETTVVTVGVLCEHREQGWPDTYGLTKIPATLWEITPLSWAFDYFFNIGDNIAAMTPDPLWQVKQVWSVRTTKRKTKKTLSGSTPYYPRYTGTGFNGGEYLTTWLTKERGKRDGTPSLKFDFDINLDWCQWTDISIVFKQQLRPLAKKVVKMARRHNIFH
jgi:hypothetical protein